MRRSPSADSAWPRDVPIVGINLDDHTQRWQTLVDQVDRKLGAAAVLERLSATDGRGNRLPDEVWPLLSTRLRFALRSSLPNREMMLIECTAAVACYHSHLRVWRMVAERQPPPRAVLVLEDDCSFESAAAGRALRRHLADAGGAWDLLLVGWLPLWWDSCWSINRRLGWPRGHRVCVDPSLIGHLFGSHSYLVTPEGARRLLTEATPIDMQVDFFLQSMAVVGAVRGCLVVPRPLAQQGGRGPLADSIWNPWSQSHIPHDDPWRSDLLRCVTSLSLGVFVLAVVLVVVIGCIELRVGRRSVART